MLNPNEAPEGYEAVEYDAKTDKHHCNDCEFASIDPGLSDLCFYNACHGSSRKDLTTVYFVRRTPIMSTISHPMGSLGEDV